MSSFEAFIFGFIQAITEFFPVSSSAHLKITKLLLGLQETQNTVIFDLCCHLGTLIAVLYFLRREIKRIFTSDFKKLLLIFLATLPLVPCYFLLKPLRELASETQYLGYCLVITGIILFLGHYLRFKPNSSSGFKKQVRDVLCIGAMQSAALIPGISRSASTISCATALGWQAKEAVQFSFLLSIPTVIGGNAVELLRMALSSEAPPVVFSVQNCAIAFTTSLFVGLIVVGFAMRILEKGQFFKPFAWYCLTLGLCAIFYFNG